MQANYVVLLSKTVAFVDPRLAFPIFFPMSAYDLLHYQLTNFPLKLCAPFYITVCKALRNGNCGWLYMTL